MVGTVFSMITTGMNGYINAQGFPKIGMFSIIIGAVTNIILDPIFIFSFDMGVRGAALATIISQTVSALWVLKFLFGFYLFFKCIEAFFKVSYYIFNIFNTNSKANQTVGDACAFACFLAEF